MLERLDLGSFISGISGISGVMSIIFGFQLIINGVVADLSPHGTGSGLKRTRALATQAVRCRSCLICSRPALECSLCLVMVGRRFWRISLETRKVISALFFTFFGLQALFSSLISLVFQREYRRRSAKGAEMPGKDGFE